MDKEAGTLKSYVRGMFLDFSISDICNFLLIEPLDPSMMGFPYPPSTVPSLNSLARLVLANEDETRARFMHAIASDLLMTLSRLMFNLILEASLENSFRAFLPFGLLVTEFLAQHLIVPEPDETRIPVDDEVPPPPVPDIPSTSTAPPPVAPTAAL
ncbi:hypothetical protein Acr_17g0010410 [Actinidia rufa]|uniref:Uncharacterized protein n=1 Tax=Actinidia rufa TaxID=165716 RepID=A0A7J0G3X2_9ERIC|nr:hypothetical protein Acr_17g0010410 [Actinidia rufa]